MTNPPDPTPEGNDRFAEFAAQGAVPAVAGARELCNIMRDLLERLETRLDELEQAMSQE